MLTVNRIGESISGSCNGKPFGIQFSEQKYALMKDLEAKAAQANSMEELKSIMEEFEPLTQENYKEIVEHAKGGQHIFVSPHNGKMFLAINGKVSSQPIPKTLVDRIVLSVEKMIDVMPLVKCWTRFLRNPWYTADKAKRFAEYINTTVVNHELKTKLIEEGGLSNEVAEQRATMYDVSFTQEGLLSTYKVVKEIDWKYVPDATVEGGVKKIDRFDFAVDEFTGLKTYTKPTLLEQRVFEPAVVGSGHDAFFSGDYEGHIIRVGQPVYLNDWKKVNCNDSSSCVKGLHAGGIRYIKNFQNDDTLTLNVFIDPADIGAITDDGTGALRVKRYFPHSALEGMTQRLYHSSEYAKLTDEEYAALIEKAVEASQQDVDKIAADLEEKKNLL